MRKGYDGLTEREEIELNYPGLTKEKALTWAKEFKDEAKAFLTADFYAETGATPSPEKDREFDAMRKTGHRVAMIQANKFKRFAKVL